MTRTAILEHRNVCRSIGVRYTRTQDWACAYLTFRGLRFLVDFGLDNCEDMADEMWMPRRTH